MKKRGSFKFTRTLLEDLRSRYDKLKVMGNADKVTGKSNLEKCLQDMRNIRKDINEALDNIENTLSKEIHQVNERTTKDIENHNAILDDALAQITDHLKSLQECEKARDDDVMYIGMKKASYVESKYEDTFWEMEEELGRSKITYKINDALNDMVKHLRSIYTILIDKSRASIQTTELIDGQGTSGCIYCRRQISYSLINLSLSGRRDIDVGSTSVFGCTFMPDGHLVLGCGAQGLKLLDKDFTLKSHLDVGAFEVAAINHNEIIIAKGGQKHIQKVKLFPQMEVVETIDMDGQCHGLDVSGDEIYVTCNGSFGGEVIVLNMDGELQRRLGVDNGVYMFIKGLASVSVSKDGSRVYVSYLNTNTVTCLHNRGDVIYQYSDKDLKGPTGMYADCDGNLLVCGLDSDNVHILGQDGRKEKLLLSETDCNGPTCAAYRQTDGCLVLGMYAESTTQSLICFTTK